MYIWVAEIHFQVAAKVFSVLFVVLAEYTGQVFT